LQRIACCVLTRLALLAVSNMVVPFRTVAQNARLHGVVYVDANGNGKRDASEHGVPGVMVSNQRDVVVTDSLGRFEIPSGTTGIVFVSVPDGFRSSGPFWRTTTAALTSVDFGLLRQGQSRTFSFVHASDSHLAPENVDRFRRFRQMTDSLAPAFVLMGGDLVRDAMSQSESNARSYFDLYAAESKAFHTPVWTVPGNHDHYGIIRSRSHADTANPLYNRGMYRQYFGPDYYSFTYGGVHFIGLNTVSPDDSAYYGDVDSLQMEWLKRDLSHVPATLPIVTFNHIPMVSSWWTLRGYNEDPLVASLAKVNGKPRYRHTVGNVLDVIEAMRGHRYVLALGSHTHTPEHLSFVSDGIQLRSDVSAAIVGGMELGPMIIPSGFTLYTVRDGQIDAGQFVRLDPPSAQP
jgi:predicted MPP superfamily phosphohydrolase